MKLFKANNTPHENIRISVCMATYNGARYLTKLIFIAFLRFVKYKFQ